MSTTTTTAPTSTLFRSRISSEDIQALLRSASETHINYRNGILLQKALEKERQCQPACEPLRKTNHISPSTPGSTLSLASRNQKPLAPSFAERKTTSMCVDKSPRLSGSIRNKIVESVTVNRLTTIVGPAGSGKSTQVPPLLRSLGAVLCTQPRRLAVVAIAKRVASEIGVSLGGDTVGFHVGNNNLSTHKTQLLFTTAGILLEELRANGSEALTRFRVLIIDECHERSPESDLILSLVKKYLQRNPNSQLRLVLMSATFPHSRYRHYFRHVPGCEVVDTITLERAQSSNQVETFYLDDIIPHLHTDHKEFGRRMRLNPDHDLNNVQGGDDKSLSDSMLELIKSIVIWLDGIEAPNSIFLIFAPTYRHLEQLHGILANINSKKGPPNSLLSISVLHSSVDMEYCLRSIQHSQCTSRNSESLPAVEEASGSRRILLASAIADSSVTVPGVSCVLDMCRSLQVRWNDFYVAKTVWASKSICDQRQGRTGRTCAGRVFRLLPRGFYLSRLPQWDVPQITLSSCLNEVLGLVCSKSDLVESDPRASLQECLDPPDPQIVEGAIEFLQGTGAVQSNLNIFDANSNTRRNSKRFNGCMVVPTQYGEILSALPLNVSDAKIVLAGGQLGLLHETIALRAIYNHKPSPIIHNFGDSDKNSATLESFHRFREPNGCYLAHLSAYMFWDYSWNSQRRRKDAIKEFASRSKASSSNSGDAREWKSVDAWKWTSEVEEEHVQWCKIHDINPTAVRAIAEVVENTMNALFLSNFEPDWLRCADPTPIWKRPRDWKGHLPDGRSMLYRVYGSNDCNLLSKTLLALLENKVQVAAGYVSQMKMVMDESQLACIHNLTGKCKYGDRCRFSHDPLAPRPPCRFYHGCGVCSKAEKCLYSHEVQQAEQSALALVSEGGDLLTAKLPYLLELHIDPCAWYHYYHQRTMLLGEGNFKFTKALSILGIAPQISSTYMIGQSKDTTDRLMGVDATRLHTDNRVIEGIKSGKINAFGWNFPYTGHDEDPIIHEALIVETFQSMALLMDETPDHVGVLLFAVALQANQFSRWNILQCTWRTGWRLAGWGPFINTVFPDYFPSRHCGEHFPAEDARFYVFELHKGDS